MATKMATDSERTERAEPEEMYAEDAPRNATERAGPLPPSFDRGPRRFSVAQTVRDNRAVNAHLITLDKLLAIAARGGASDLLLKVGQLPMFRYNGELYPLSDGPRIDNEILAAMITSTFTEEQLEKLDRLEDVDASYQGRRTGRVRVNLFRQRGQLGMVCRLIPAETPTIDKLELVPVLKQIAEFRRGLILCVGATGSGKSTTLAAMVDHINSVRTAHIITIEDPIEFLHTDRRCMINQRELGLDTCSFASALRSALRQNPDIILVGELRDVETIEVALQAAETGHLVMASMHATDTSDAVTRVLSAIGPERQEIARIQLAESLRAVIGQRLVRRQDVRKRVAAQEILINTATIREQIMRKSSAQTFREFLAQGTNYGMQTFDQHLFHLYNHGIVSYEEGWRNATVRDDFDLWARGVNVTNVT